MDFSTSKTYPNYLYSPETNFTLSQPLIYLFFFFISLFGFLEEVSVSTTRLVF